MMEENLVYSVEYQVRLHKFIQIRKSTSKISICGLPNRHWILLIILTALMLTACGTPASDPTATESPVPPPPVTSTPSAIVVPSPAPTNTPEPKTIIAIGDSYVSGGKLVLHEGHESTIKGGWVTRLQSRMDEDFPGEYQAVNMGLSGRKVLGIKPILPEALQMNPYIVLIQIGGNDFLGPASHETYATILEDFELRMAEYIEQIQQGSPETIIYLVGYPVHLNKYAEESYSFLNLDDQEVTDFWFQEFNNTLENLAVEYDINFIDILTPWPEDEEGLWALSADGIHADDNGYELMTDIIYDAIIDSIAKD